MRLRHMSSVIEGDFVEAWTGVGHGQWNRSVFGITAANSLPSRFALKLVSRLHRLVLDSSQACLADVLGTSLATFPGEWAHVARMHGLRQAPAVLCVRGFDVFAWGPEPVKSEPSKGTRFGQGLPHKMLPGTKQSSFMRQVAFPEVRHLNLQ